MYILSNIIHFPGLVFKVLMDVFKQKNFIKRHLQTILNSYKKANDGSISETDFVKIVRYYGFGTTAVLAENVATLRQQKLSFNERWASTCQGAITGLFDDFFDEKQLPQDTLIQFIEHPEEVTPSDMQEKMFLEFYQACLNGAHNRSLVIKYFKEVNENQVSSLLQTKPDISLDEIMQITFDKGGNSVLFYRSLLAPEMSESEIKATYHMGALMQMANDIFDVYKDSKAGIQTIINSGLPIVKVRSRFKNQMDKAFSLYAELPYSKKVKQKVLRKLSFGISRVYVALDQYEKLEQKTGGVFSPEKYSRKELICDMEKLPNLWQSTGYYIKYKIPN